MIGRGGFGTVYRAKLLGQDGFEKDVAIKLLKKSRARPKILARFRDEARMLGLARDRALVAVDPPTRMDDTWAVVMEYVAGVPTEQLLENFGPLPVGVVLEIAREVARSLDAIYNQAGPDGRPLKLLHRDLKPANLQLTPTGTIKILDFGIARADFDAREAKTINGEMAGTAGYMAPERLEGRETPEGDVYSLGTLMRRLLTGDRPVGFGGWREKSPRYERSETRKAALELAEHCQHLDAEQRPTMREVEDQAHALLRHCEDPPIGRWAEKHVPPNRMLDRDHRVGLVLTELGDAPGTPAPAPARPLPAPRGRTPAPAAKRPTPPKAPVRPPPPPSLPPPVGATLKRKTVKPQTLYVEEDTTAPFEASDEPNLAEPIDKAPSTRSRSLPVLMLAIPAGALLGIVLILGLAATQTRSAARHAHTAEQQFVDSVRLESAAIGFALERAGASPTRIKGEIGRLQARPNFDTAIGIVDDWDRLITVLPATDNARTEADRRDLRRRVKDLQDQHQGVLDARDAWQSSVEHLPGTLGVALGLAERPPKAD
ncbi:MAG: serine/threonine protein kinase [Proteobacteria bacterium]|nr:serine/threonine protein kinase [Pseudomonadota bacterium]